MLLTCSAEPSVGASAIAWVDADVTSSSIVLLPGATTAVLLVRSSTFDCSTALYAPGFATWLDVSPPSRLAIIPAGLLPDTENGVSGIDVAAGAVFLYNVEEPSLDGAA